MQLGSLRTEHVSRPAAAFRRLKYSARTDSQSIGLEVRLFQIAWAMPARRSPWMDWPVCRHADAGTARALLPAATTRDRRAAGPSPERGRFFRRLRGCILLTSMRPARQERGAAEYRRV